MVAKFISSRVCTWSCPAACAAATADTEASPTPAMLPRTPVPCRFLAIAAAQDVRRDASAIDSAVEARSPMGLSSSPKNASVVLARLNTSASACAPRAVTPLFSRCNDRKKTRERRPEWSARAREQAPSPTRLCERSSEVSPCSAAAMLLAARAFREFHRRLRVVSVRFRLSRRGGDDHSSEELSGSSVGEARAAIHRLADAAPLKAPARKACAPGGRLPTSRGRCRPRRPLRPDRAASAYSPFRRATERSPSGRRHGRYSRERCAPSRS